MFPGELSSSTDAVSYYLLVPLTGVKEILTQQVRVGILVTDLGCYSRPRIELAGDAVDALEVGQPVCIRGHPLIGRLGELGNSRPFQKAD